MTRAEAIDRFKEARAGHKEFLSVETLNMAIEALEKETCGDAISRQAVLEGLASIAKAKARSDAQKALMGRVMFFTEHLSSVNPQEPRWIPVSERLPEIDEPVLIFQRYYSGANITIGRYHSDEDQGGYRYWQWIKYDNHFSYGIDHFGIICPDSYYVDAWMPLPEPYKTEGSGEE